MSNRARGHGRSRTAVAALVAALATVGLIGCTPGAAPASPTASPSASPVQAHTETPTSTPTPTAPGTVSALPDGAKPTRPAALDGAPSLEAAQAVLGYWLQLLPYAQQTGDVSEAKAMSHPECVFCSSMTSGVDELVSRGDRSVGGGYTLSDQSGYEVVLGNWYSLQLTLVEAPSSEVDKFGVTLKSYPGHTYAIDAVVLNEAGVWTIREVSYEVIA